MRKNPLLIFFFLLLCMAGRAQVIGGITATTLAAHFYNGSGSAGYLTFGFSASSNAGTSNHDPLTIQQSNASVGININSPKAKLHIRGSAIDTTSAVLVNNSVNADLFRILNNGNVGIGTATPQSKLAVNGTITSTKVTVTQTGWPDFVFDSTYHLRDLCLLEQYIKANKHLPGVAAAAEVEARGVDLGENQAALLQKIEELTLYVIQQQKVLEAMKAQSEQVTRLQMEVAQLKATLGKKVRH